VWSVDGNASLSADTALKGMGVVPSCGRVSVEARPATITLTASKLFGHIARNQQVVSLVEEGKAETMGPNTQDITCDDAHRELVASVAFEPEEYDPAVLVKRLDNPGGREVLVVHRGGAWTVPSGGYIDLPFERSNSDASVSTAGTWILRVVLRPQERCGTPSALPALRSLLLNATLGCRENAP